MASTATTFDTDCVLMLHMDGTDQSTTFTDSSFGGAGSPHTMTANGNAKIVTAQSKFGGASGLFDKLTTTFVETPDSTDWDYGTADLTVDMWVRFNSATGNQCFFDSQGWSNGIRIFTDFVNVSARLLGTNYVFGAWAPSTATWYHVALTRASSTLRFFVDGSQIGANQTSNDNITGATTTLRIGANVLTEGMAMDGWIDEVRVVKGTAVWTANFTPPSAAYVKAGSGKTLTRRTFYKIGTKSGSRQLQSWGNN